MNGDGTIETRLTKAGYAASIALLCSLAANAAWSQTPKTGGPTPSSQGAEVYFFDLKDGASVPSKFKINFGLRNMGVAPAGSDRANSGHHHVLVDTELPPLNQPIPNDFNHLHFGSGQTEAEVTLPAGEHTLQLLMGDKDHIPHTPPVMSPRIRVRVVEASARKPAPKDARVYFVGLENGSAIRPQVTIRFGLVNMGIAPAGVDNPNTGHHHVLVDTKLPDLNSPIPNDFNHLHFGAGQTEATVKLPLGKHSLRLLFADENHVPHNPVVMSEEISVVVTDKEPERTVKRRSYKSQRSYRSEGSYRSQGSYRSYRSYGGHSRW
jgi:Domain of unknown function (DUF4399)